MGCPIGARTRKSAKLLWESLPKRYLNNSICYTDGLRSYQSAIPAKQHRAVGKESGQTNHIERFKNTVRQRVYRLVRKVLSFSKDFLNHCSAIWMFIHHYNENLKTTWLSLRFGLYQKNNCV
ncbi:MAG: IS1 family transposase [Spirulinaceae cyanobacterium]